MDYGWERGVRLVWHCEFVRDFWGYEAREIERILKSLSEGKSSDRICRMQVGVVEL